jgi:hypothetical protein
MEAFQTQNLINFQAIASNSNEASLSKQQANF